MQPKYHGYDHSYVEACMRAHGSARLQGSLLLNGMLSPEEAAAEVRRLSAAGFSGMRVKPTLFEPGERITGPTGMAAARACAERGMPVSVLTAVLPELEELERLATTFPTNPLILEHFGGHRPGSDGWEQVLHLARFGNVYVKCTATPGLGGSPAAEDVGNAILELLGKYLLRLSNKPLINAEMCDFDRHFT